MSKKNFYIYLLINSLDNKVFYVGKGYGKRMYWHKAHAIKGDHHNKHLQNKIRKLINEGGKLNYEKVFESENEELVFKKEIETIKEFGFENLCNLTEGGEGSTGYVHSEASIEKMKKYAASRNWIGEKNPNYGGGNWTDESKKKFSEYKKRTTLGESNSFYGKTHSSEAKSKMSEARKGENHIFFGKKRTEHSKRMAGEGSPTAKLTAELVAEMREEYAKGDTSYRKLANKYNIDYTSVADIIKYRTWKLGND
jgi:hypothetical protein